MNKKETRTPIGEMGLSCNYFNAALLPDAPSINCKTISSMQPYSQHDGIKLLYLKEGQGTLWVNGEAIPVSGGSCFFLFFYHFHRLEPLPGTELKIVSILMSYSSYLFLSAAPSWDISLSERTPYLPHAAFEGPLRTRCEEIIASIQEFQASDIFNSEQQIWVLLAELIARLFRE